MKLKKRFSALVYYQDWTESIPIEANRGALLNLLFGLGSKRSDGVYSIIKQAVKSPNNPRPSFNVIPDPIEQDLLAVCVIDPDWPEVFKNAVEAVHDGRPPDFYLLIDEKMAEEAEKERLSRVKVAKAEMAEEHHCVICGSIAIADNEDICGSCKT